MTVLDAFSSGSIPRFTALRGLADLDVIAVLHYGVHIKGKRPSEVLQSLRDALSEYRTNVRKNGQAVTLYYKTWPNVDIVPAAQISDASGNIVRYEIPDAKTEEWITSNPKAHALAIDSRSASAGPLFRKMIKMMKHWSQSHGDFLQSYHIEVMALTALTATLDDVPWTAFQFFDKAKELVKLPLWHAGAFADAYLSYSDRKETIRRLDMAASKARDAWYLTYPPMDDDRAAIGIWRQILGTDFPAHG
jgi:hypothetical protein